MVRGDIRLGAPFAQGVPSHFVVTCCVFVFARPQSVWVHASSCVGFIVVRHAVDNAPCLSTHYLYCTHNMLDARCCGTWQ